MTIWLITDISSEVPGLRTAFLKNPPQNNDFLIALISLYHFQWLMLVSVAVLYNFVFVIGRAVFWELNNAAPALWWTLDYTCDIIYLLDILVHAHEGKRKFPTTGFHLCLLIVVKPGDQEVQY
jgi:hypothetical protein